MQIISKRQAEKIMVNSLFNPIRGNEAIKNKRRKDMNLIESIREMENDLGLEPINLNSVNISNYYNWLLSGYRATNKHAECPDF